MTQNYTGTYYTQAVGGLGNVGSYWSGRPPERLSYPNQQGSSYLPQFGQGPNGPEPPPVPEPLPPNGPAPPPQYPPATVPAEVPASAKVIGALTTVGSIAGTALGAYHGYKRNNSIGWGIAWALLGGMFWPITIPLSFAMKPGFAKRKPGR